MNEKKKYIVMPDFGYRGEQMGSRSFRALLTNEYDLPKRPGSREEASVTLLAEIPNQGPKLVELSDEGRSALQAEMGGSVKIVPLQIYPRPQRPYHIARPFEQSAKKGSQAKSSTYIMVVDDETEKPIEGARVLAYTRFRHREGLGGFTNAQGMFPLDELPSGQRLERLVVYGPSGYWGHFQASSAADAPIEVRLLSVESNPAFDVISKLYGHLPLDAGRGITVGVIDTGISRKHASLTNISGGRNCVFEETHDEPDLADDWDDVDGHGTHVAGTVGSKGLSGAFRGVAPGVTLRAYRVFSATAEGATSFDIMRAIDDAVADGCDIINLSLGMPVADDGVRGVISYATEAGVLVVAAAGNDGRRPVCYPAGFAPCVAVSAIGVHGTFPPHSSEREHVAQPISPLTPMVFLAGFTNTGPQIKVAGPGVGVVSTLRQGGFGPMSGTSMASPAIAGFAAYLLASDERLSKMPRNRERWLELTKRLYGDCAPLDMSIDFVGSGLPLDDPSQLKNRIGGASTVANAVPPKKKPPRSKA